MKYTMVLYTIKLKLK